MRVSLQIAISEDRDTYHSNIIDWPFDILPEKGDLLFEPLSKFGFEFYEEMPDWAEVCELEKKSFDIDKDGAYITLWLNERWD